MNLKRLRGIATVALITIAAALFAGCSNSMAGSVDGNYQMATLSLSATGIPNDYAEQFEKSYPTAAKAASRSITPNKPFSPDAAANPDGTTLTFYLTGTSETGKKLDGTDAIEVKLALKAGSTNVYEMTAADGTAVTLPSMSWNLVLTAYTDGSAKTEPVLQGFCSVDLRNGSGTASFKLSPENLTTPGSVKITGEFPTYDNVASYTMGIYKKTSASELIKATALVSKTVAANTTTETFEYECNSVPPGNYLYKMIFQNSDKVITGSFIDTLIVDAGNPLERDLDTIDVVNKKPGKPTNFTASLEEGSENADGTYRVKLSWESGKGETNFEVELTEYKDDGSTPATGYPKIYGMSSMDKDADGDPIDHVIDFQGSDVWAGKGGAMTYGDTEAFFKLKLGVLYDVRIRARNYVGTSSESATETWTARSAADTTDTEFEGYADDKKINRFKIEYNLNGGILSYYNGAAHEDKTVNFTEYKTWEGTNLPLITMGTGATDHKLIKGTSPFAAWLDSTNTSVTDATSHKNLSVTASFGSSVTGSASMGEAKKDVALGDIKVKYTTASADQSVTLSPNGTYTIPKKYGSPSVATKLTIQLAPSDATYEYKNIQFELSYNGTQTFLPFDTSTTNQCTLSLDDYVAGKIQVRVIADTENATSMSQTLTFDLQ
ncbi:MAG: hypothetical protein HDR34_07665 [Treponema sp.]|nr:hypothetical protein [Treponema sp.]